MLILGKIELLPLASETRKVRFVSDMSLKCVISVRNLFVMFSAEKDPTDKCYQTLCASLSKLAELEHSKLQQWLSKMIMGSSQVCILG